jgi:hypothetical protein
MLAAAAAEMQLTTEVLRAKVVWAEAAPVELHLAVLELMQHLIPVAAGVAPDLELV